MKKPLQILKALKDGKYSDGELFKWIILAMVCIQENQKVIYDLLPKRENVKGNKMVPSGQTITVDNYALSSSATNKVKLDKYN